MWTIETSLTGTFRQGSRTPISRMCATFYDRAQAAPSRAPRGYSPHRSLIALGTMLTTVAIAAGALGVVESARAEESATLLTNR